jgi:DNA-directed RNA polymerase specialized sigma subunit
VREIADEIAETTDTHAASIALKAFQETRREPMTTQEEVCWLRDHYPDMTNTDIAKVLGVSKQLVGRYVKQAEKQRRIQQLRLEQQIGVKEPKDGAGPTDTPEQTVSNGRRLLDLCVRPV